MPTLSKKSERPFDLSYDLRECTRKDIIAESGCRKFHIYLSIKKGVISPERHFMTGAYVYRRHMIPKVQDFVASLNRRKPHKKRRK